MNNTKSVFVNSIIYTIGNILLKAFTFFLIPVYTAHLSTEEYGVINLAAGFYGLIAILVTLSLPTAVVRYYADCKDDPQQVRRLFSTAINFILIVCLAFMVLAFLTQDLLAKFLFDGVEFFPVILLSILISVVSGLYQAYQEILKGMQRASKSMLLSYVFFFVMLAGNILGVVVLDMKSAGVLLSTLVTNAIMVVVMFVDLYKEGLFGFSLDKKVLGDLMRYALPLVPHTLAYTISTYASKVIINKALSLAMLGIYSLANQLGFIADVVLNSVQNAFQPWMFETLNQGDKGLKQIQRVSYALVWVYGLVFLGLGSFCKEVVLIMAAEEYVEAWRYVPAVVAAIALKCPTYFLNGYFYYHKEKTKYIFRPTVVFCVVNVLMSMWLIPIFGIYGSIMADIIAMTIRTAILVVLIKREQPDFYSVSRMVVTCLVSLAFMIIAIAPSYMAPESRLDLWDFLYKVGVIVVYCIVMLVANKKVIVEDILQKNKTDGDSPVSQ